MGKAQRELDELCIRTIRMLAVDAIEQANSGHPGLPLGAAPMAYVLWTRFMRFNPKNPLWPNRDRFVLSAGHGSALLYALLHLTGHNISLEEIKNFRQWGSKTPGHPERDPQIGVEVSTGPLGQGVAMGVGMAVAERFLGADFNRPGFPLMDHYTYAIVSDGDLMEGVASEAASLAGNLQLGKLIYLYDDNGISIEGSTSITFTEDRAARFASYGWHTTTVEDGNDLDAIEEALTAAHKETERPSLILVKTHIGYGSPKQGSASAHGEPLGKEAVKLTRAFYDWEGRPLFHVPEEAAAHMRQAIDKGIKWERAWVDLLSRYREKFPENAERFERQFEGKLPEDWAANIPQFSSQDGKIATRVASGKVLNAIAERVPNILGGSADLAPSTKTLIVGEDNQSREHPLGRNLRFGVREHGMGGVVNGIAAHGGLIPYGATFLVFADFMRPAIRLSALMGLHVVFVLTHDSIGVGEDGPTHQPVEHVASLRCIPNLFVLRPADANETAEAWRVAMELSKPVALILTRQGLPILDRTRYAPAAGLSKGAYILSEPDGDPEIILIASGSEVHLALEAQEYLAREKSVKARVVSMPSWELFVQQPKEYRDHVLPPTLKCRVSIEAGSSMGWCTWVGDRGASIAVDRFGASAPGGEIMKRYGFTVDNIVASAMSVLDNNRGCD
ncbi:MAG: transketolase [Thermodesulfobacteriota bacterium]